jgi:hypothetical protein
MVLCPRQDHIDVVHRAQAGLGVANGQSGPFKDQGLKAS